MSRERYEDRLHERVEAKLEARGTAVATEPAPAELPFLNDAIKPARDKPLGCRSCSLYQYAPCFGDAELETYLAKLDPDRDEHLNNSYQIEGEGPTKAKVMVVLDSPGRDDDKSGQCASGGYARTVRAFAGKAGVDYAKWYWTFAVRCRGPKAPKWSTGVYCSGFLGKEVQQLKPQVIVALGNLPTQMLLGRQDATADAYRCVPQHAVVAGHPCIVYPMWGPGLVLANDYLADRYIKSWRRFGRFMAGLEGVAEDKSEYRTVEDIEEAIGILQWMLKRVEAGKLTVDCDLETTGLNPYLKDAHVTTVSLAMTKKHGFAFPYRHKDVPWTDADRQRFVEGGFRALMTHPNVRLRWVNGKFDYKWFPLAANFKFWPRDIWEDAMLSHYAADENENHGLKPLALRYTDMGDYDRELDDYLAAHFPPDAPEYHNVPWPLLGRYAAMDSVASLKVSVAVKEKIDEQRDPAVETLAYRVLPAYSAALTRVEAAGVEVDPTFLRKMQPWFEQNEKASLQAILSDPVVRRFCNDREQAIRAEMKRPKPLSEKHYFEFSLNSGKQLIELLYGKEYYGHEIIAKTKKGAPATDKEVMQYLADKDSPIAKRIIEWRLDSKLLSTYLRPMLAACDLQIHPRIHPSLLAHGTKTGRLSCKDPNLQNIPNKGASVIKRGFISRYGDEGVIIQADYSQIELRILACVAGDRGMIEAFLNDIDPHAVTACLIFGYTMAEFAELKKTDEKLWKELRTIAKRINFGIPYGTGAPGIASMLKGEGVTKTVDECQGYIDKFFDAKPKVKRWIDAVQEATVDEAISRSLFGRNRRLETALSKIESVVARAKRQAVNHPIQSTASDLTMTSLTLMEQEMRLRRGEDPNMVMPTIARREFPVDKRWKRAHTVLTVHDSIVFDVHQSVAADVVAMVQRTMPNVVDLAHLVWGPEIAANLTCLKRVPIAADVDVGPNYRDAEGVKSPDEVQQAYRVARHKRTLLDADHKFKWDSKVHPAQAPEVTWHAA